jgi:hypothetical protein
MRDDRTSDDDVRLAALRAMLDDGINELEAGCGVEMSPEDLMGEVFAELGIERVAIERAGTPSRGQAKGAKRGR